jgi:hypothetical protein
MRTNKLSNTEYHATAAISSSAVKTVASKSIAHWKGQVRTESTAVLTLARPSMISVWRAA